MGGPISFKGLPAPREDHLTLYLLGPGFGESLSVALPDGRWMVVDSCLYEGCCLTAELLKSLGVRTLHLLVLTHPDLDHLGGVDELVGGFDVLRLWRYPGSGTLGDLLSRLLEQAPHADRRQRQLRRALEAVRTLEERNRAHEIGVTTGSWPPDKAAYQVTPIAPPPHDLHAYRKGLERALVEWKQGRPELAEGLKRFLLGTARGGLRAGLRSNALSVALSIGWKSHRLLLGGDVEYSSNPQSGWSGVLEILREDDREHLVRDCSIVKAAHHGSDGAFCEEVWQLHAQQERVKHVLVTPFLRGRNPPPHTQALERMSLYSERLVMTATPKLVLPPRGWRETSRRRQAAHIPCVALVMAPNGGIQMYLAQGTHCFERDLGSQGGSQRPGV